MYHQILASIDHSVASKPVFEAALSLATLHQANLILLQVISVKDSKQTLISDQLSIAEDALIDLSPQITHPENKRYDWRWVDFKQQEIKLLRSLTKQAIAAGISAEFTQITGIPPMTICEFARSCHADMIVLGKRGYSNLTTASLGRVSDYVIQHAPCSTLLVSTADYSKSFMPKNMINKNISTIACT